MATADVWRPYGASLSARVIGLLLLSLFLGGCQQPSPLQSSSTKFNVIFTSSTTYTAAMSAISDLGLRHSLLCRTDVIIPVGSTSRWTRWESTDEQVNFTQGATKNLIVSPTVLAPSDWQDRLRALSVVSSVSPATAASCGGFRADAEPTPGTPYFLTSAQANNYARVTVSQSLNYGQAVAALDDLGLRLADPCRERASQPGGASGTSAWTSVGQQQPYAADYQLVVATTTDASTLWQEQAKAIATGTTIETPYTPSC